MLTAATAVWGSAFVVTKGTLTGMAAAGFLTWRFGIAAVVLALVGWNRIRAMTATDVRHGVLLAYSSPQASSCRPQPCGTFPPRCRGSSLARWSS